MYTWTLPSSLATPVAMGAPTNRSDRPSAFRSTAHTLAPKYEPSFTQRHKCTVSLRSERRRSTPSSAFLPPLPTVRRRPAAGFGRSQRQRPAGKHTQTWRCMVKCAINSWEEHSGTGRRRVLPFPSGGTAELRPPPPPMHGPESDQLQLSNLSNRERNVDLRLML